MNEQEQLDVWLEFYKKIDDETALKRAIKKVYKHLSPAEQEKICNEIEVYNYDY